MNPLAEEWPQSVQTIIGTAVNRVDRDAVESNVPARVTQPEAHREPSRLCISCAIFRWKTHRHKPTIQFKSKVARQKYRVRPFFALVEVYLLPDLHNACMVLRHIWMLLMLCLDHRPGLSFALVDVKCLIPRNRKNCSGSHRFGSEKCSCFPFRVPHF